MHGTSFSSLFSDTTFFICASQTEQLHDINSYPVFTDVVKYAYASFSRKYFFSFLF